jgi:hypothetical protein
MPCVRPGKALGIGAKRVGIELGTCSTRPLGETSGKERVTVVQIGGLQAVLMRQDSGQRESARCPAPQTRQRKTC